MGDGPALGRAWGLWEWEVASEGQLWAHRGTQEIGGVGQPQVVRLS